MVIKIRIEDRADYISSKKTDESVARVDSVVPLMHCDPSDFETVILIHLTLKERTHI